MFVWWSGFIEGQVCARLMTDCNCLTARTDYLLLSSNETVLHYCHNPVQLYA